MNTPENKFESFKTKLSEIYNSDFEKVFATHSQKRAKTFRINRLVDSNSARALEMLTNEGIKYELTSIPNFYIVTDESVALSRTEAFNKNLIYIQELSSALPVIELNPKPSEKILDMCASPGSKTSLIQSITNNQSYTVAVEKNRNRFFKLKDNLNENGVANVNTFNIDANRLIFIKPDFNNYFDKVLVDVPCTTESKINLLDPDALKEWKPSNAKDISKLQKGLLNSAFKMLKRNGTLIYSTCTYSVEENEEVVNWFLKKNPNAKLIDIELNLESLRPGKLEYKNKKFDNDILKTARILPTEEFTAFYLAKITKL